MTIFKLTPGNRKSRRIMSRTQPRGNHLIERLPRELVPILVIMMAQVMRASVAIEENVDVELQKIANLTAPSSPAASAKESTRGASALPVELMAVAMRAVDLASPIARTPDNTRPIESDTIFASEAASRPPIYRSAPKQIENLQGDDKRGAQEGSQQQVAGRGDTTGLQQANNLRRQEHVDPDDLSTAAGHHKKKKHKKKKKKKVIVVVKKKKKKKHHKKKKKKHHKKKKKKIVVKKGKKKKHHKKKKKKVIYYKPKHSHRIESKHQHYPSGGHHKEDDDDDDGGYSHAVEEQKHHYNHHHEAHKPETSRHGASAPAGKYYEYRSVPKKGAWEFGFKRGNDKHLIERKEHGHKSHFKTLFNWVDKKGKGKHLFDYNHGDYKKHHHTAAATQVQPKQLEPAAVASANKSAH